MKANKLLKTIATAALAATMTFTTLAVPTAAAWKTTDSGKQWVNTDGTVAKSKWLTMKNGDRYYINSKGVMATGILNLSEKENGKKVKNTYYFNKSGVMQTGWQYVNKKYYYFDTKTGKAYKGTNTLNGYTLNFDEKGVWDQKLYNSKGKDVTTDTLVEKVTGIAVKKDTITIKGQTYNTSWTTLTLNQPDLTDEDLEPLKYMTKLKFLCIVPGSTLSGDTGKPSADCWDYTDVKITGTKYHNAWKKNVNTYEATRQVRNVSVEITNVDFCAYMPKLETMEIAYAPNLTDLKGLQNLKRLTTLILFNCTGLKDLHDLDDVDFVQSKYAAGVCVDFTENVKYAFTDYNFGPRISSTNDSFSIVTSSAKCKNWNTNKNGEYDDINDLNFHPINSMYNDKGVRNSNSVYNRYISWCNSEIISDYTK